MNFTVETLCTDIPMYLASPVRNGTDIHMRIGMDIPMYFLTPVRISTNVLKDVLTPMRIGTDILIYCCNPVRIAMDAPRVFLNSCTTLTYPCIPQLPCSPAQR